MSIFLQYEGIKGESTDSGHKDWIDVKNWQWATERKITSNSSTHKDRESSNARIYDLAIAKYMDKATPKLFLESCCGTGKTVKMHISKTGKGSGADVYMEYTFKNCLISSYSVRGSEHDVSRPIEDITISFVDLEVKYIPYDDDGNAESPISVGFDTASNTKH